MQLNTDDRNAGLETPDGRTFKPDANGVITLPEDLASFGQRAARQAPMFHVRKPMISGFDAAELRARYEAWERQQREGQA